ncbi:MAG: hypothetical protein HQ495_12890 [Alphaproteobacteria bacterium]|nr:hypothetical protein [Alphaproteobacteria bacterium]
MHLAVILVLALVMFFLVRRGFVNVDLSFPWFIALLLFGILSTSEKFVATTAQILGIVYSPIATIFVTIFIVVGLVTALLITVTRIRQRQIMMVRALARLDLIVQESNLDPVSVREPSTGVAQE